MTPHVILSSIIWILFCLALFKIFKKQDSNYSPFWLFSAIIFFLLPVSFWDMSVIAHYLLVFSPENISWENILWYVIPYSLLLLLSVYFLYKTRKIQKLWDLILNSIFLLLSVIWLIFVITQSAPETQLTPIITDTIELFLYWLSIQTWILIILTSILRGVLSSRKRSHTIVFWLLSFLYLIILYGTIELLILKI
jgi:hypothetical protein